MNHSNIITLFDSGYTGKNRFVVMEYVSGETLQNLLDQNEKFTISEIIDIMEQVLDALVAPLVRGHGHTLSVSMATRARQATEESVGRPLGKGVGIRGIMAAGTV